MYETFGTRNLGSKDTQWRSKRSTRAGPRRSALPSVSRRSGHQQCGRASTFIVACLAIVVWAATGPIFQFSDTWQLVINTGTTIVTFLMVFLIQNTQNRDMSALHLKLDELIRVSESARNKLPNLEDMTEEELERLKGSFARLAVSSAGNAMLQDARRI